MIARSAITAHRTGWIAVLGFVFLLLGALVSAHRQDAFQRKWFTLRTAAGQSFECVSVFPRTAAWPAPVVLFCHGAGGSLLQSGYEIRQMAELDLAVVGIEYDQTNAAVFPGQVESVYRHLVRQPWADTNRVAWVGMSLGAQRWLALWCDRPDLRPKFFVRIAGGWVEELDRAAAEPASAGCTALLLHGEADEVFPLADARRVASRLRELNLTVELEVMQGLAHRLDTAAGPVYREAGERCLTALKGPEALRRYRSIHSWQADAAPPWPFLLPAAGLAAVWVAWRLLRARRDGKQAVPTVPNAPTAPPLAGCGWRWARGLAWTVAAALGVAALGLTALHLALPRFPVSTRTLDLARTWLVPADAREEFEFLAGQPSARGRSLRSLLDEATLAAYTRRLVAWKAPDALYREFVLSRTVSVETNADPAWRRMLWESIYPRVRKEMNPVAAASLAATHLRERVTIAPFEVPAASIPEIWRRQLTDAAGFERLYVAALRSVGVPARLDASARAELWSGSEWVVAPRPVAPVVSETDARKAPAR